MKYIITGCCGFIGANLLNHIAENEPDSEVLAIDNLHYDTLGYAAKRGCKVIPTDISKDTGTEMAYAREGYDVMIHLAANTGVMPSIENPMKDMEYNVKGTLRMLEVCRANNIRKFIYASSGAVLGEQDPPLHEEMVAKPISPYGVSKLAGEKYCRTYAETFGIDTVVFRFSNVYGPYSAHKNSLIAKYMKAVLNKDKAFPVYGDGKQTRDFIYVDDLVNAIMLAVRSDVSNEVFQLCTFQEYSVLDVLHKLNDLTEKIFDRSIHFNYEDERAGEVKRSYADNSKIKDVLGFKPRVSIDEGLKKTFDWFMETGGQN